jgi:putative alpha-1,2-mannosidase
MSNLHMALKSKLLLIAVFLFVVGSRTIAQQRPVDYVNPLIGTAPMIDKEYLGNNPAPGEELYSGTVNPCAMVPDPNGYFCVGPVTGFDGVYHVRGSGYRFDDSTIMGFTHMNGEYSDENRLLFMPTVGPIKTGPGSRTNPSSGYRSAKDALSEKASPGYYSVFLTTYGVKVEITSSANCGFHRYSFSRAAQANVLIDLANSRPAVSEASVKFIDKRTIEGVQAGGKETVYFRAEFNKDISSSGTWNSGVVSPGSSSESGTSIGAYVTFNTSPGDQILVKVGTSRSSMAEAEANLESEIAGRDFDTVRQQGEELWSKILSHVVVEGGSKGDRTNFYTAVYRMAAGPMYSWFPSYDANGMLLARGSNWVSQRVSRSRWNWGGGYWGPGNVSGLVGMYKMGFHPTDLKATYERLRDQAMNGGGTAGAAYRQYGYIPVNSGVNDYVNRSIGLSNDDSALSEMAKIVGQNDDSEFFLNRSKDYMKLFNPSVGFFVPRRTDGSWILPLDPIEPHAEDIYREGNPWNYLWFNTGDIKGLIGLLGGPDKFGARLDAFFNSSYDPKVPLRDLTGVVGLYFHGNEQYRHIPYLYNYAGQPWKTQALVRRIQKVLYLPIPAGLCGMDDFGDLEGWYVTSALGYIQVDRASEYYEIGSPLFPKVTIKLEGVNPGIFIIRANNVSDTNKYIQSATLNGKPLNVPSFRQSDMTSGGSLVFEMGPKPNFKWGTEMPH